MRQEKKGEEEANDQEHKKIKFVSFFLRQRGGTLHGHIIQLKATTKGKCFNNLISMERGNYGAEAYIKCEKKQLFVVRGNAQMMDQSNLTAATGTLFSKSCSIQSRELRSRPGGKYANDGGEGQVAKGGVGK